MVVRMHRSATLSNELFVSLLTPMLMRVEEMLYLGAQLQKNYTDEETLEERIRTAVEAISGKGAEGEAAALVPEGAPQLKTCVQAALTFCPHAMSRSSQASPSPSDRTKKRLRKVAKVTKSRPSRVGESSTDQTAFKVPASRPPKPQEKLLHLGSSGVTKKTPPVPSLAPSWNALVFPKRSGMLEQ